MQLKTYFLTSEISPFSETSFLSHFSKNIPIHLQQKDQDIRITSPKYGFISERKFILREVIWLREIPFVFDGKDQMTSAKSAFIPRTRVQVYFLEHLEWFKPLTTLVYKSKNGRILSDNPMRYSFYGIASLATLPHLFWCPDIIICNGWQSSMVPIIYNQLYKEEKFYKGIKTVQVIHSIDECSVFSRKAYEAAGVKVPDNIKGKSINTFEVSSHFSDHIIVFNTPGNNVANKLLKLNGVKANKEKLTIIDLDSIESPDFSAIANEMEIVLKKLSG